VCNLHGPVRVPETVGVGTAQVAIAFDAWSDGSVGPTMHGVAVVAPKSALKLEALSARLKGELIHPNRTSTLSGVQFSPDGRRLIAGDYPGGVVTLWDVATSEQLSTIEADYASRGSTEYFFLSPDWRTLFVPREKRKYEMVERDGKRLIHWEMDGNVRAWDLATGRLRRTYKHQPARSNRHMELSPDGRTFVTFEELPGLSDPAPKRGVTLWDVSTGQLRPLPDGLGWHVKYSPDGRTIATTAVDAGNHATALKLLDVTTGREKWSIPVADKNTHVYVTGFTPDGRVMVGDYRVYEDTKKYDKSQSYLKWWDVATGRELASFAGEKNGSLVNSRFSPDGQTLAVVNWGSETRKLLLFRTANQQLAKTVILCQQAQGERLVAVEPAFSPDGRWVAVITQRLPDVRGGTDLDARDVAQPWIHLVDVPSGAVRETLIAPQGFARSINFSPDGRTLATGGLGRVLLWDLSHPPGPAAGGP
jgi:WD40 repeat protein